MYEHNLLSLQSFLCEQPNLFINIKHKHIMKSRTIFAVLAGAAVGAVLGIFLAPDKGEESRKKVKKAAGDCVGKVKEKLSNRKANAESPEEEGDE